MTSINRRKNFLTIGQQVDLLVARGLSIPTREDAANFLKRQNYYRFSGYARYFQNAPSNGDPRFKPDAHWDDIVEIYNTDIAVRALLLRGIQAAEIAARAAFALSEGALHSPYEEYLEPTAYKVPKLPSVKATNELIISELRRSKEPYLAKYRRDASDEGREWIYDVPVWAAVEALSLGTLSKAISFRNDGNAVYSRTCSILGTKKQFLASQMRSFTFVRNKCAHSARLWNCFVLDQPAVADGVRRRAERMLGGEYDSNSVLSVIVALDNFLYRAGVWEGFLKDYLAASASSLPYRDGIARPSHS